MLVYIFAFKIVSWSGVSQYRTAAADRLARRRRRRGLQSQRQLVHVRSGPRAVLSSVFPQASTRRISSIQQAVPAVSCESELHRV